MPSTGSWITATVALLVFSFQGRVSAQQLQEPISCVDSAADGSLSRISLGTVDPFYLTGSPAALEYPDVAAQYNLSRACCPNNSYIVEWEVVLKTFIAPQPFNDGQYRSLNGTLLSDDYVTRFLYFLDYYRYGFKQYANWSDTGRATWDDIQGIALTILHNKTIVGSLQARCGLRNGTIAAVLPRIGANLTSDCWSPQGLEVSESHSTRVINSTSNIFNRVYLDNHVRLPKDLTSGRFSNSTQNVTYFEYLKRQDRPYQDWMGLMRLSNLSAATAPAVVDIANFNWRYVNVSAIYSSIDSYPIYESVGIAKSESAAAGFTGIAGCYGPMDVQLFNRRLYLDTPPTPGVSSYGGCSYNASSSNSWSSTYTFIGSPVDLTGSDRVTRFSSKPLVCCPNGEYVKELDLQFREDVVFSSLDPSRTRNKHLWAVTGICSQGTKLPEISAGNGCTGSSALLSPENYNVTIPYDADDRYTSITYRTDGYGMLQQIEGQGPNSSVQLGAYSRELDPSRPYPYYTPIPNDQKIRIVGLDSTATCSGIASLGMVLRTLGQINEPADSGGLSKGAIAGIVVGVLAFVAAVVAVVLLRRRRRRASKDVLQHIDTDNVLANGL